MTQTVKNLPATQETQVQSLRREDPLEKEMATHFLILAWRIPWTEEPVGLQSMGSHVQGLDMTECLSMQHARNTQPLNFPVYPRYFLLHWLESTHFTGLCFKILL